MSNLLRGPLFVFRDDRVYLRAIVGVIAERRLELMLRKPVIRLTQPFEGLAHALVCVDDLPHFYAGARNPGPFAAYALGEYDARTAMGPDRLFQQLIGDRRKILFY